MVLLYHDARGGELDPGDATRLVYILVQAAKMISDAELEQRVAALEAMAEGDDR